MISPQESAAALEEFNGWLNSAPSYDMPVSEKSADVIRAVLQQAGNAAVSDALEYLMKWSGNCRFSEKIINGISQFNRVTIPSLPKTRGTVTHCGDDGVIVKWDVEGAET